mmetsp:Transcript_15201/g.36163  ORF Transcript_15201/g.36163 Transcript_15201/m.36163 type:complete len:1022 (+) Transcript_15201:100-3165(+)
MGRGQKRKARTMKRDFKEQRSNEWRYEKRVKQDDGTWGEQTFKNDDFEEYYRAQSIVPEEHWEEFLETLRSTLPTTFRINGSNKYAGELIRKMENDLVSQFNSQPIEVDGELIQPPKYLPWYPGKLAWQFSFSRHQLRKAPQLEAIHEFVKRENDSGTITRQEAVSMVPPLFLDVQPHHKVLDMCAAPGSKTFQILEMLHFEAGVCPSGLVIANDSDVQRCNLLTHQTKRHCSPCLIVTNHEGQFFPNVPGPYQGDGAMFDRILCDVPCSGDGTLRKAPDIWRKWSVGNGIALHPLQVRIALQAARLLKVGGRMIYSTCSFNPVENEAVVAELLRRVKGSLRLLDMGGCLPDLRRSPGLLTWKVRDKQRWYENYEDVKKEKTSKITETMFPQDDLQSLGIERCMRFLPHHQDTGGFFVCVFEKVSHASNVENLPTKKERQASRQAERNLAEATASVAAEEAIGSTVIEARNEDEAGSALKSTLGAVQTSEAKAGNGGSEAHANGGSEGLRDGMGVGAEDAGVDAEMDCGPNKLPVADSSVRAMGFGAVAHNNSVDSDAEGGVTAPMTTSAAQAPVNLPPPGRRVVHEHQNQSAGTVPLPPSILNAEPALSIGQSASADTVQAPASVSIADDGLSKPRAAASSGLAGDSAAGQATPVPRPAASGVNTPGSGQKTPGDAQATSTRVPVQWGARGGGGRNREGGGKWEGMDPILPVSDPEILDSIYDFYGLQESFPLRTQLITRSVDVARAKRLYFVSEAVRDLLASDEQEKLKIQATGVKILERQKGKEAALRCHYRIAQEGLQCIVPHVTKQILKMPIETFLQVLKERSLPLPAEYRAPEGDELDSAKAAAAEVVDREEIEQELKEKDKDAEAAAVDAMDDGATEQPPAAEEGAEDVEERQGEEASSADAAAGVAEVEAGDGAEPAAEAKGPKKEETKPALQDLECLEQLRGIRMGGCIAMIKDEDMAKLGLACDQLDLAISCWRGMSSINILVSKAEAAQLCEKIAAASKADAEGTAEGPK